MGRSIGKLIRITASRRADRNATSRIERDGASRIISGNVPSSSSSLRVIFG
jgi:hypothetical protein